MCRVLSHSFHYMTSGNIEFSEQRSKLSFRGAFAAEPVPQAQEAVQVLVVSMGPHRIRATGNIMRVSPQSRVNFLAGTRFRVTFEIITARMEIMWIGMVVSSWILMRVYASYLRAARPVIL